MKIKLQKQCSYYMHGLLMHKHNVQNLVVEIENAKTKLTLKFQVLIKYKKKKNSIRAL